MARSQTIAAALFVLLAVAITALGLLGQPLDDTGVFTAALLAAALVVYREGLTNDLRRDLTWLAIGTTVLYAVVIDRVLLGILAGCAICLTSFLTGPNSSLRAD